MTDQQRTDTNDDRTHGGNSDDDHGRTSLSPVGRTGPSSSGARPVVPASPGPVRARAGLTTAERSLRASLAANTRWAHAGPVDRQRNAFNGQAGLLRRFAAEVQAEHGQLAPDELERRARNLLTAHMKRLALRSSQARRGDVARTSSHLPSRPGAKGLPTGERPEET